LAERQVTRDPRRSVEERYPDHLTYVRAVSEAADALVRDRLLLEGDADQIVRLAKGSRLKTQD
jgi:hypothetical protein